MIVDKIFCMSSYLMYRTIVDCNKTFKEGIVPRLYRDEGEKLQVHNSVELLNGLKNVIDSYCTDKKVCLALSGGIDSAILAKLMPEGSKAFTFQCIVDGKEVINEVPRAVKYAKECKLDHEVVPIYWDDFEKYKNALFKNKQSPFHSIEVQIYKASLLAKKQGYDVIVFGESADVNYGGLSGLLSKDWKVGEFVDRYSYVLPYKVLKQFQLILTPYLQNEHNGYVEAHEFCKDTFYREGMGSYTNACETAGIKPIMPYAETKMAVPLDYKRVRKGENKYLVREIFSKLYPQFDIPPKTPMPRPMDEWLTGWEGPKRNEFWPHCTDGMTGDQKWLVWCLEKYLDYIEQDNE